MTNIEEILSKVDKSTLSKFKRGTEISRHTLPTASFGINMITGGLGVGKQTTFYGGFSTGKSALMLETIGLNQRNSVGCAYIDAEKTFDPEWAARLGVDTNELIVSQVSSIEEAADISVDLISAGVELIVIDSTSALLPNSYFDKSGELKDFGGTNQQGQEARDLGKLSSMVGGVNYSAAFVELSQVRMDLGGFIPSTKASGGKAVEHFDSLKVFMSASNADSQAIKGEVMRGSNMIQENIGRTVNWNIKKNKVNGRYAVGQYDLYTQGEFVGIDRAGEVAELGLTYGVIGGAGGAHFTYGDYKFHGRPKLKAWLAEEDDIRKEIEEKIIAESK